MNNFHSILNFLDSPAAGLILGLLVILLVLGFQTWRDSRAVPDFLKLPAFSRRRKRAPLDETLSVALTAELKDELVRISGNQQSKYVRASVRLALPILKAHPSIVDMLDEE
ncbi:hypothetical protein [Maridesulfovibrio sp. FT414]|uniref:hypothetical protein n=1 Tax=Maridesulfovibrio sp. FT414 TaxID=2979469 RepID=UPI003D8071AB